MTIAARSVVQQVMQTLNDGEGVRTPASYVVVLLNRAQRDMVIVRPDISITLCAIRTKEGYVQPIPPEVYQLVDITALAEGSKRAISKVDMALLDATEPAWRSMVPTAEVRHYLHDSKRDNRTFYTYPPAAENTLLRAKASLYPTDVPSPIAPGLSWESVVGDIGIGDEWESALVMLTLAYCYMTDLEGVGNSQMAQAYQTQAATLLGVQLQSLVAVGPQKGD